MSARKAKPAAPAVEARVLTEEWSDTWPYEKGATVVLVEIDGHTIAEAVVTMEQQHPLDGGGMRPKVLMRGVIERLPVTDADLGLGRDAFPVHVSHTGARIVQQ